MQKKKFPYQGQFDKLHSTYKHQIYFTNGKMITGYNKGANSTEIPDKIVALETCIENLVKNGYLNPERTIRIDFFYNKPFIGNDEFIFTLYPSRYSLGSNGRINTDNRLLGFFNRLYKVLKEGKNTDIRTIDIKDKKIRVSDDDLFDYSKKRFHTEAELHTFISSMERSGYPEGQVMDFFYKYKQNWFE